MRFKVWDVGHGSCIEATAQNGNVVLFDCGRSDSWQPHKHFKDSRYTGVELLTVSNYDEDHIADLPDLRAHFGIDYLKRNTSISATQLYDLKLQTCGTVSTAMSHMLDMIERYKTSGNSTYSGQQLHPGINLRWFHNQYGEFTDTNNLSVVTVVEMGTNKFVVTGDMEYAGWDALLKRQAFTDALAGTTVFIASHHGRESGFHEDIFKYITPALVVVSDSEKQFATQEMTSVYAQYTTGVQLNGETRYVLTTRCDGSLQWTI